MPRTIHISKDLGLGPFPMDEKDPQVKIRRSVGSASVQCHDEGECEARPSSSYHLF